MTPKLLLGAIAIPALSLLFMERADSSLPPVAASDAVEFQVDPGHSGVLFRIGHLGVSNFYGRFNEVTGAYTLDEESAAGCSIQIEIACSSVDTNSEDRDKHIKGPDFLLTKQFPKASFTSTKISGSKPTYRVVGDLTLRGETREVEFEATLIGSKQTRMGYRSGFEGTFSIDRSDFGMDSFPKEALTEEIQLTFFIEGIRP